MKNRTVIMLVAVMVMSLMSAGLVSAACEYSPCTGETPVPGAPFAGSPSGGSPTGVLSGSRQITETPRTWIANGWLTNNLFSVWGYHPGANLYPDDFEKTLSFHRINFLEVPSDAKLIILNSNNEDYFGVLTVLRDGWEVASVNVLVTTVGRKIVIPVSELLKGSTSGNSTNVDIVLSSEYQAKGEVLKFSPIAAIVITADNQRIQPIERIDEYFMKAQ
ncbi:MAG: hypothetical protein ACYC69_02770 [Thermodesulfovibrionales bacterium]